MTNAPFSPGSRVRAPKEGLAAATVLARHGSWAWLIFEGEDWPTTYDVADLELDQ